MLRRSVDNPGYFTAQENLQHFMNLEILGWNIADWKWARQVEFKLEGCGKTTENCTIHRIIEYRNDVMCFSLLFVTSIR